MRACLLCFMAVAVFAHSPRLQAQSKPEPGDLVPWQELNEGNQQVLRQLLHRPTLASHGPVEIFFGNPEHYFWYLDHPDLAVHAWRRLGAKCVSIHPRKEGRFAWTDEHGSEIMWFTMHQSPECRIWYAEGKVKPNAVTPMVPVRAAVVLTHHTGKTDKGRTFSRHQTEILAHTDSKAAAMVTKLMGTTAQRTSEQALGQFQLFFSGLTWYLERHPEHVDALLHPEERNVQPAQFNPMLP